MPDTRAVADHYTHGALLDAIRAGLTRLGRTAETVAIEDLAPVDEFHIGGRVATEDLLDQIGLETDDHVLDVGCGLGGSSRFVAHRYGSRVTGVDLTAEYIEAGNVLSSWLGLDDRVTLEQGDASAIGCPDGAFDKAFMLHVGMNIADKAALARELYRVLEPGGTLGIYDIMCVGGEDLTYPVPWAAREKESVLGSPEEYREALEAAGFRVTAVRDRREFALEFFARLQAKVGSADGPPPLGLHILMGETAPAKIRNMVENVAENRIAPIEVIAEKPL